MAAACRLAHRIWQVNGFLIMQPDAVLPALAGFPSCNAAQEEVASHDGTSQHDSGRTRSQPIVVLGLKLASSFFLVQGPRA